jgi:hypothetical protein
MKISRRFALLGCMALPALSACGLVTAGNNVITINLATAQAEAKTLLAAAQAFVLEFGAVLPAAVKAQAGAILADLETAVAVFASIPSGSTNYVGAAQAVIGLVEQLMPLLPIPGPASSAISAGLMLLSGLIAGVATISVPAAAPSAGIAAGRVIAGPVPIPLS